MLLPLVLDDLVLTVPDKGLPTRLPNPAGASLSKEGKKPRPSFAWEWPPAGPGTYGELLRAPQEGRAPAQAPEFPPTAEKNRFPC